MDSLRSGTIPWRQPWGTTGAGQAVSLSTGKPYRGINQFLLSQSGYTAPQLCAVAGIDASVIAKQAAYVRTWLDALGGDAQLVLTAAARAQHAADYIQGLTVAGEEPVAELAMAA
jgi:antirestriction protein ArdC